MDAVQRIGQRWASGAWFRWMHRITLDAIVGFGLHWIALDVFVFGLRLTHWTAPDVLGSVRHVACGLPGQPGGVGSGVGWRFDWDSSVMSWSIVLG